MSQENRAGKTIRQAYSAFWKEWIILVLGLILIGQPGLITGWAEAKVGAEVFEGLPVEMIIRGVGILAAIYALIFKIGYDILANRYTLSDDEVVEVYGIIQKKRRVTKLEHIRRVSVEIGIVGRIFGFGDVLYFTAGSGGADIRLRDIPNPEALAEEADNLARRKQAQIKAGEGEGSSQKGSGRPAAASGQILDAFRETVSESVAVQREILKAIHELRAETRRSTSTLSAAMAGVRGNVPLSESESATVANGGSAPASAPDGAAISMPSSSDHDAPDEADESDSGDAFESSPRESELEDWGRRPEEDSYESTPKMFDGDWEDILAPGKDSGESVEATVSSGQGVDAGSTDNPEPEPESELARPEVRDTPESNTDPEYSESAREKEQTDVPVTDDEFVGLLNPRKQ